MMNVKVLRHIISDALKKKPKLNTNNTYPNSSRRGLMRRRVMSEVDMLITVHFGVFWYVSMIVLGGVFAAGICIGKSIKD